MMTKRPFYHLLIVSLALFLSACGRQSAEATLKIEAMRFSQTELQVKAGKPVTLHIVNKDGYSHAFDMDSFNIHSPLAANETVAITFTPEVSGSYSFYCGSPGHKAAGMVGTLLVTP